MRKIRLKLDDLDVSSFTTDASAPALRGTVRGAYAGGESDPAMQPDTLTGCNPHTAQYVCASATCGESCGYCVLATGGCYYQFP